jgi:hypothetical protein
VLLLLRKDSLRNIAALIREVSWPTKVQSSPQQHFVEKVSLATLMREVSWPIKVQSSPQQETPERGEKLLLKERFSWKYCYVNQGGFMGNEGPKFPEGRFHGQRSSKVPRSNTPVKKVSLATLIREVSWRQFKVQSSPQQATLRKEKF